MDILEVNKICVITSIYPHLKIPENGAFVESFVSQWQEIGVAVDVVAPLSFPDFIRSLSKMKRKANFSGDRIERPKYMSFSNKNLGIIDLQELSRNYLLKAAMKSVNKLAIPDIYFGKFLMSGGLAALNAGKKYNRPAIADLGESRLIQRLNKKELKMAKSKVPQFNGFVCVSKRLVNEVVELGADKELVLYAPNTVNNEKFSPMDKKKCRKQLNLPMGEFIVIFVGHFIDRKGPLRVLEAINLLDIPVKGIFLGSGKQKPKGEKVLYTGSVPNDELPIWLNAANLFVLPTLAEGYCNAINEAMACGLPIVSSNIPDVKEQVNESMGILVDPSKPEGIADAIEELFKRKNLRNNFSLSCIEFSRKRFAKSRAIQILEWIKQTPRLHRSV